jgi:hypothetical protein
MKPCAFKFLTFRYLVEHRRALGYANWHSEVSGAHRMTKSLNECRD